MSESSIIGPVFVAAVVLAVVFGLARLLRDVERGKLNTPASQPEAATQDSAGASFIAVMPAVMVSHTSHCDVGSPGGDGGGAC